MPPTDDAIRGLYATLVDRLGSENADTLMDHLATPGEWRRLIPWHSGTRPHILEEVRLRRLYTSLVGWLGEEMADLFMDALGVRSYWYRPDPSESAATP